MSGWRTDLFFTFNAASLCLSLSNSQRSCGGSGGDTCLRGLPVLLRAAVAASTTVRSQQAGVIADPIPPKIRSAPGASGRLRRFDPGILYTVYADSRSTTVRSQQAGVIADPIPPQQNPIRPGSIMLVADSADLILRRNVTYRSGSVCIHRDSLVTPPLSAVESISAYTYTAYMLRMHDARHFNIFVMSKFRLIAQIRQLIPNDINIDVHTVQYYSIVVEKGVCFSACVDLCVCRLPGSDMLHARRWTCGTGH